MSGRRGVPAAPRWSDEQLAQLSAVLDRAEEAGQGFDRVFEPAALGGGNRAKRVGAVDETRASCGGRGRSTAAGAGA